MKRTLLFNKSFKISLLCIAIGQLMVASSTFFIANLAKSVATGVPSLLYAVGFVGALTLVLIPLYYASIYFEKAKFDALATYYDYFEQKFINTPHHYNNTPLKNTITTLLSSEAKATLDESLDVIYDATTLVLNVGLNLVVIAWVLDSWLLAGYVIGMVLASICVHRYKNKLTTLATTAQNSRLTVLSWLSYAWDNVIIFNKINYVLYKKQLNDGLSRAKNDSVHAKSVRLVSSNVGMVILLMSALVATGILLYQNRHDVAVLAMLVATLPRQIQMLQMSHELINYQAQISTVLARLNGLFVMLQAADKSLDDHMKLEQIFVKQTGQPIDLQELIQNPPQMGRLTLMGQNGAGKSCVLLTLKAHFGERACYLPAKHELCFSNSTGSTGQKLMSEMCELIGDDTAVLLLDEWDANLDTANTKRLDAWLDEVAQHKWVVEVRH